MITLFVSDFKYISQDIYDRETVRLQLHRLTCPSCGHSACLTIHGYYTRSVHTQNGPVSLRILRVKCSCGRTHAILLSSLVPYSRVLLADQVKIAASASPSAAVSRMEECLPDVSEWSVRNIFRNFCRLWKQRLLSMARKFEPLSDLVRDSFLHFFRQFLQIHSGSNLLFSDTT